MAANYLTVALILVTTFFWVSAAAPNSALITELPGFSGTFPSKHYAGYVTIDEDHGKNLFYYFVVSEGNPTRDPVVLWLNGGPGCSSFDGYIYEHGPFNFQFGDPRNSMPKLHLNPYSWSKVSNIIYLDSPAGVGLSYSKNQSDYVTGDLQTASDSHKFLLKWFQQYPEFLANPFYIAGESYAGVYVPTLASEVVRGIESGLKPILNFKGYMVGNGVTDAEFDGNALVPFAYGMALISTDMFKEANQACQGSYWKDTGEICSEALEKINNALEGLNVYNILEPCYHSPEIKDASKHSSLPPSFKKLGATNKPMPIRKRMFGRSWPLKAPVRDGLVPTWPELESVSVPCTNDEIATFWLNNKEVRSAIHARSKSDIGPWVLCTRNITYDHDAGSMIDYHKNLTSLGYPALIYSGDHDMCVPYTGTEAWTKSVGYKIIDEWRPWFVDEEVAGYIQSYANHLTFLTIKGCGHTVAEYKPKEALAFYSRWLSGTKI